MLLESCHKIEILNNYFAEAPTFIAELKESCIEARVALLSFLSCTLEFMRKDIVYLTGGTYQLNIFRNRSDC
jgi:hypothetical protein